MCVLYFLSVDARWPVIFLLLWSCLHCMLLCLHNHDRLQATRTLRWAINPSSLGCFYQGIPPRSPKLRQKMAKPHCHNPTGIRSKMLWLNSDVLGAKLTRNSIVMVSIVTWKSRITWKIEFETWLQRIVLVSWIDAHLYWGEGHFLGRGCETV